MIIKIKIKLKIITKPDIKIFTNSNDRKKNFLYNNEKKCIFIFLYNFY